MVDNTKEICNLSSLEAISLKEIEAIIEQMKSNIMQNKRLKIISCINNK